MQRPGLKPLFDIDLKNLKALAQWLDSGDDARDFVSIWAECADVLYREAGPSPACMGGMSSQCGHAGLCAWALLPPKHDTAVLQASLPSAAQGILLRSLCAVD